MATRTEGQRLLNEYLLARGKGAQAELARAISRTQCAVSYWKVGKAIPDTIGAVALEPVTGIPPWAWTAKPKRKNGTA